MRIGISHWQGRVAPVFDVSEHLCLVQVENGTEMERQEAMLVQRGPLQRAQEVSNLGVGVLLCGAVSRELETALMGRGIQVVPFLCGDREAVLNSFLSGNRVDPGFRMPGCAGPRGWRGGQGRRRRGRRGPGVR